MREILVDWNVGGIQSLSVLYFEDTVPVNAQRAALGDFYTAASIYLSSACNWSVRREGRELSEATGTLTGFWSDPTTEAGAGSASGTTVPDAAQALMRLRTSTIVRGRVLQGRSFIPGLSVSQSAAGNVASATVTALNTAAAALVAAPVLLSVWSRPVNGAGGVLAEVESATFWSEWAVLRRRRR